ncbi:uncharacterized protein PRCAT00001721001 [Priceomyces carsonii]|uniref:uncharacterized protein n=1 Tax=Priceomyces carsonii TaxID=28549 RepID=UPI002EDA3367|nr:unnamed protein product [Priceomyces carsonii]
MNTTAGEALNSNIYRACNGEYKRGVILNRGKLVNSSSHRVKIRGQKIDLVINKDAEDIDAIFQSRGICIPPDEILDSIKTSNIKIPMKFRDEFADDVQLPSSDLLKVLHYYASKKIGSRPENRRFTKFLDESALLGLGMMVERYVEDLVSEHAANIYLTTAEGDSQDNIEEPSSHSDSDVTSIMGSDILSDND